MPNIPDALMRMSRTERLRILTRGIHKPLHYGIPPFIDHVNTYRTAMSYSNSYPADRSPRHTTDRLGAGLGFYIVWNPNHPSPPREQYRTEEQAQNVAEKMAAKNPGEQFVVLASRSVSQRQDVTTRRLAA